MRYLMLFVTGIGMLLAVPAGRCAENPAGQPEAAAPREVVDRTIRKVTALLLDEQLKAPDKEEERREKVRATLLEFVDMDVVGALTLANNRKKFSDAQFRTFKDEFSNLLFKSYIANLEKYSGERVEILDASLLAPNKALVKTRIQAKDKEIPVVFSLAGKAEKWSVYDVRVEGVSMVLNYREQFREILANGSVDRFLERLKDKRTE